MGERTKAKHVRQHERNRGRDGGKEGEREGRREAERESGKDRRRRERGREDLMSFSVMADWSMWRARLRTATPMMTVRNTPCVTPSALPASGLYTPTTWTRSPGLTCRRKKEEVREQNRNGRETLSTEWRERNLVDEVVGDENVDGARELSDFSMLWHLLQVESLRVCVLAQAVLSREDVAVVVPCHVGGASRKAAEGGGVAIFPLMHLLRGFAVVD